MAGEELYTWCALDTLIFPALLDRPAKVESASPVSGEPVRVNVDPTEGATSVDPPTAVVSLVNPEQITSIRSSFCNQVHYFTSPRTPRLAGRAPGAEVVPVAEACRIGPPSPPACSTASRRPPRPTTATAAADPYPLKGMRTPMMSNHDDRPGGSGLLLGAGAALLMVACCALLPILIAGGAIAGIGAFLRNPWVIGAGIALAILALIAISRRGGAPPATAAARPCPPTKTSTRRTSRTDENHPPPPRRALDRRRTRRRIADPDACGNSADPATAGSGSPATVTSVDGQQISLPANGKPTAVFFFSVGCGECVNGVRSLGEAATTAENAGTVASFLAVDMDPGESKALIGDFMESVDAEHVPAAIDDGAALSRRFEVAALSTLIVVDADGTVTFRATDPDAATITAELAKAGA